jgi:hypothetical protein
MDPFEGIDWEWLAVDADGCLAVFTVVHGRPMPKSFRNIEVLDQTSDFIRGLPVRTSAELLVDLPRSDDYLALSERGLFAYDWTDFHRSTAQAIHRYEMLSRPRIPVRIAEVDLPPAVRDAVWDTSPIKFVEAPQVTPPNVGFQH